MVFKKNKKKEEKKRSRRGRRRRRRAAAKQTIQIRDRLEFRVRDMVIFS